MKLNTLRLLIAGIFLFSISAIFAQNTRIEMEGESLVRHPQKSDRQGLYRSVANMEKHKIGFYLDGAYSCFFTNLSDAKRNNGYALGGGLVYEYQHLHFLLQTGIGAAWQSNKMNLAGDTIVKVGVVDKVGDSYTLRYSFNSRVDSVKNLYLQVPLLFGGEWNGLYFLAGVKLNLHLMGNAGTRAICSTTAEYDQYIIPFSEMDNHGLRKDVELRGSSQSVKLRTDVLVAAELGYSFHFKKGNGKELRIAGFLETGLFNINPKGNKPLTYIPDAYQWDFSRFELNHLLSTGTSTSKVHNFFAGIKLTLLFNVKSRELCPQCVRSRRMLHGCKVCQTHFD